MHRDNIYACVCGKLFYHAGVRPRCPTCGSYIRVELTLVDVAALTAWTKAVGGWTEATAHERS